MMLAEPMSSTALPDIQAASAELAKANAAHEAGRLDEAQAAYLAALQANPYSPEAEHGLAWLAVQRGDWRSALPRFKRAITLRPWEPEFWISQIEALFQLGQDEAVHRMLHRAGQSGLPAGRLAGFEARLLERRLRQRLAQQILAPLGKVLRPPRCRRAMGLAPNDRRHVAADRQADLDRGVAALGGVIALEALP